MSTKTRWTIKVMPLAIVLTFVAVSGMTDHPTVSVDNEVALACFGQDARTTVGASFVPLTGGENSVIVPATGVTDVNVGRIRSSLSGVTLSEALPPIPPECPRGSWRQVGGRTVLGMIYTGTCIRFSYQNIGCKWCTCHYIAYFNGRHWTWSDAHDDCGLDLPVGITV